MCSISGFISKKPLSAETAQLLSSALLFYGEERGSQSSGVLLNGNSLLKKAQHPHDFIFSKEFDEIFKSPVNHALLHTRQPTCGGTGDDQAQPFMAANTAVVHNGWLTNTDDLKRTWNIKKSSGVDSQLAAEFISSYGIMKMPRFVKSAEGAGAFGILYNGEMYLMRSGSPISYTYIDFQNDNSIFIFASTGRILTNAIRYVWLLPTNHPINDLKEGILFRVSDANLVALSGRVQMRQGFSRMWGGHWPYGDGIVVHGSRGYKRGGKWNHRTNTYDYPNDPYMGGDHYTGDTYADGDFPVGDDELDDSTRQIAIGEPEAEKKPEDIKYFKPDKDADKKD